MRAAPPRRTDRPTRTLLLACFGLALQLARAAYAHTDANPKATTVQVRLTEWSVKLTPAVVPPGKVVFQAINAGTIPHAFEVEGRGMEKSSPQIPPGGRAALELNLPAGRYEAYCPVGKGSHKMLGMITHLTVGAAHVARTERPVRERDAEYDGEMAGGDEHAEHEHGEHEHGEPAGGGARRMTVVGGGPVIQILPGPFPFADSALAVIHNRPPDQQADLAKKAHMGPYSNNVAPIDGNISLVAIERGATGDSVSGVASFTAQDGSRWKLVMDRVQTKDIPFNPRFGGVIMGLFYHGASGVHTPLVPTIQSSLALWAYAHLYENDRLVTDDAMVHIMLLSRTRRPSDWALDCWDCSDQPIEELQLQVTPPPGTGPFQAPGGVLFVNWEESSGKLEKL